MTEILRDLPGLWRRTSTRVGLAAALILGAAAAGLPLLEVPGYELSEAAALLAALALGPWLGTAAARQELARPDPSPAAAWVSSSAVAALLLAGLFAGSAVRAAFGPCPPLQEAAFFPVLAIPSALLGCALGSALGLAARGRRGLAGLLYAAVVLLALAWRLAALYRGPEAYALDPLLGYFPGPLYDEAVPLDGRLLAARVAALGWAAAVAGAAALARGRARRERPLALRGPGALLAAGLALVAAGWCARAVLQGGVDLRTAIADRLGGRRDGPRCTLFLASEKPAAAADELLAECEFHVADVAAILGIPSPPHVTVYVYRSAEERRQLIGAAHTDFTRPWRAEIQLLDQPLPHPVLRHEIVHAVASALAPGPLHLPARLRVLPDLALVEGLAVALESHRSGFTLGEWSRAARDLGYLPDLSRILGPTGFWSQAPARAYTAAGSFLAFLLREHGPGPVDAAYRTGDLAAAFGQPLPALVREWQRSLDELPPREGLAVAAERWFGRGSLFERRCAREAAALLRRAGAAAALGRTAEACLLYGREARIDAAPDALQLSARALAESGQLDAAEAALRQAAARVPPEDRGRLAELRSEVGDLRWRRGDVAGAIREWREASRYPFQRAQARLLEVKTLAAADPALGPAVRALLLDPRDPGSLPWVARFPQPLAGYLAGRWFLQQGERGRAAPELARAVTAGLPPLAELEARLTLAEASCDPAYHALLAPLASAPAADRDRLDEARRRCAFEATSSGTARTPPPGSSPRSGSATTSP